ncbi:phosphatase PAP2 family protein [Candidatus Gottesmanbacteria bacterium]|nr:phosphatase PAP2 family protein [Candidatus Gottesmanbacteria bacterium]
MEHLLALDQQLFLLINHLPHTSLSNAIALAISGVGTAGIIWFFLAVLLFVKEEKKATWFFAPILAAGGTSLLLIEQIIKPLIARPRPTFEMGAIILGNTLPDFSFPSGHATIAWALAVVLAYKEPKWKTFFFILAFLISFSRMYIGKHYPLDVLFGALLGWGIGRITLLVMHVHGK